MRNISPSAKRTVMAAAAIGVSLALVAGCSSGAKPAATKTDDPKVFTISNDPVTLSIYFVNAQTDEVNQKMFIDPVSKKYPNITLQLLKSSKGNDLRSLVTAGSPPDLIYGSNIQLMGYLDLDIFDDITPWIKKMNLNMSKFRPETIDSLKASAPHGELFGLPFMENYEALYYNKDIFDKFGVAYPKDGMTWDDAVELAKKLTRTDAGVKYSGLAYSSNGYLAFPIASPYVDPKTNKAVINNDKWQEVFQLGREIQDIPGNEKAQSSWNNFLKNKDVAMYSDWTQGPLQTLGGADNTMNWDVAQLPSFKELPNINGTSDGHYLLMSKTSKYKDQAMAVMDTVTSADVQLIGSRMGMVSPLNDPSLQQQFGSDLPNAKGKHLQSVFKSHQIMAPAKSSYYQGARSIVDKYFNQYRTGEIDINTALKTADDEVNKYVATQGN